MNSEEVSRNILTQKVQHINNEIFWPHKSNHQLYEYVHLTCIYVHVFRLMKASMKPKDPHTFK